MWVTKVNLSDGSLSSFQDDSFSRTPDLIFLFQTSEVYGNCDAVAKLTEVFPDVPILGCSTGTIIEGSTLSDEGATAIAVGFERTRFKLVTKKLADHTDSRAIGHALGLELFAEDLAAVFILSDGLNVNGTSLVAGLSAGVGTRVAISGGLAGDGARFEHTFVHANGSSQSHLIAAIGFYGSAIRIAHGYASGWDVFGPNRTITRSQDNVLFELDGKPALDLYERYLGDEAADLPASGLLYPLQIWSPEQPNLEVVRTVLAIDRDARSMTFAGDMPLGWKARLMRGRLDSLIDSARDAATLALSALKANDPLLQPTLCLTVSCVGRRLLLGQRTEEEVKGVEDVLGDVVPQIGFYSYGEIAPQVSSSFASLHNQTLTITLMAEVD